MYRLGIFSAFTLLCKSSPLLVPRHPRRPRGKSDAQKAFIPPSSLPPDPGNPSSAFSLWICVFWMSLTNRFLQRMTFCIWFLWLSLIVLRVIYVVACVSIFATFLAQWDSIVWTGRAVFLDSSVDGHRDCFHFWTVVKCCCLHTSICILPVPSDWGRGMYLRVEFCI